MSGILTESPELYGTPIITGAIGVKDRFGESGAPWELIKEFEVSAEHIAQKAVELRRVKKSRTRENELAGVRLYPFLDSRLPGVRGHAGSVSLSSGTPSLHCERRP